MEGGSDGAAPSEGERDSPPAPVATPEAASAEGPLLVSEDINYYRGKVDTPASKISKDSSVANKLVK